MVAALAAEGMQDVERILPQGLKPKRLFALQAARIKPSPFKALIHLPKATALKCVTHGA